MTSWTGLAGYSSARAGAATVPRTAMAMVRCRKIRCISISLKGGGALAPESGRRLADVGSVWQVPAMCGQLTRAVSAEATGGLGDQLGVELRVAHRSLGRLEAGQGGG